MTCAPSFILGKLSLQKTVNVGSSFKSLVILILVKVLSMYLLPALLTPLPFIPSITEEITGCTNEVAKGANNAPRNSSF